MNNWHELSLGGVLALLVLKEVFNFLKKNNGAPLCINQECQRRIREIHNWVHELVWKETKKGK